MTDSPRHSVFDNRYRYDTIYPRGRSGETLRAWDTQDDDRPVVIKRPAPQDAPPLRAAQEVSIKAERRALERLTGHPVVAGLRGAGTFRVGGQSHEYIVVERAQGQIVEELVRSLAEQDERLPLLEVLVIIDELLDLLSAAHEAQVVYNDVDAKHLFWSRDDYRLTVIDWGNAVLLDEAGRQAGVTRQTDVYQVGELLYFILAGGKRFQAETTPEGQHVVNFGADRVHIPPSLQTIISQATHPNTRRRYTTIAELRAELAAVRRPLAEKRDRLLQSVGRDLQRPRSQDELQALAEQVQEALAMDPGYPQARQLQATLDLQRKRLTLQADIDAARIYLDSGNWGRARQLMSDLLVEADAVIAPVIRFIVAAAELLEAHEQSAPPPALGEALDALLAGEPARAGQVLVTPPAGQQAPTRLQLLLADRMSALIEDVILLRPPLLRLATELEALTDADDAAADVQGLQERLDTPLEAGLQPVIDLYRAVRDGLNDLRPALEALVEAHELAYGQLLDPLGRAQTAAQAVMQHLNVVSLNAYGQPGRAGDALRAALAVDPHSANLAALNDYFDEIHQTVAALGDFTPARDGSDLVDWFGRVLDFMEPYAGDLEDRAFHQTLAALEKSAALWQDTLDALILGRRSPALTNLARLAEHLAPLNEGLVTWLNETARQTQDATRVERLSPNNKLAQRLIEGYQLWDQGKFGQAAEHARQIADYATTPGEQVAVERLLTLGEWPHRWLKEDGASDPSLTAQAEQAITGLWLPDEAAYHEQFIQDARRSEDLYLKMMGRGLVDWMAASSTAGLRILFLHYVWNGMLAAQDDQFEEADFWRQAALKTLDTARTQPVFAEFDRYLTGRKLVIEVQRALNAVRDRDDLLEARQLLNQPLAEQWLGDVQAAVRQLEEGLTHWEDGDFQSARFATDEALRKLRRTQDNYHINIQPFITWVEPLAHATHDLHQHRQAIEKLAHTARPHEEGLPQPPDPDLAEHLEAILATSQAHLGSEASYQMQQWLATYESVLQTHLDRDLGRNEKLIEFEAHFNNLFIDKHPAFPLFEVWRRTVRNMPEPVEHIPARRPEEPAEAEPEQDPPGEDTPSAPAASPPVEEAASADEPQPIADDDPAVAFEDDVLPPGEGIPWTAIGALGVVVLGLLAFIIFVGFGEDDTSGGEGSTLVVTTVQAVVSNTPAPASITPSQVIAAATQAPTDPPTDTPAPSPTPTPSSAPPTDTPSPAPTDTLAPTVTATPDAPTAVPTTPSVFGAPPQNLLEQLNTLNPDDYPWDGDWFQPGAGGAWQLGATEADAGSGQIPVLLPPDFLELQLGPDAARRILSVEAEMELTVFDPDDVAAGVFFGLGVQNDSRQRSAAEVRIARTDPLVVNFGVNQNGTFQAASQLPQSTVKGTLRVTRQNNGTVALFWNDQLLGFSSASYQDQALTPVLYTSGGGVFVVVTRLEIELAPIGGGS